MHRPKPLRQRLALRVFAHIGGDALISCAFCYDVTAVADMRSKRSLVWFYVISAKNVIVSIDRDICRGGRRDPGPECVFLGYIPRKRVAFSSPKNWFDDAPNIIPFALFDGANFVYVGLRILKKGFD